MKWDWIWLTLAAGIAVGGVVYYNNTQPTSDELRVVTVPERTKGCRSLAGEMASRLDACLAELRVVKPSKQAAEQIEALRKTRNPFVIGSVAGLNDAKSFAQHPDVRAAMLGKDEAKVAKVLRGLDFRMLVVHRDLTQALDRDSTVLARLANHDHLEWFQLRYVTPELMVYTVRGSASTMPVATGESLLRGLRARMSGQPIPRQSWKPDSVRLIGTLRLQGGTLVMRHAVGSNLETVLDELSSKMVREWERKVEVTGMGTLPERLDDIRLEVHVVMERAPVEARDRGAIFELFEMGMDGALFQHRKGVKPDQLKFSYMPGSELMTNSWRSVDAMLQEMVKQFGWRDRRPWEDTSTRLDLIRTEHFMEMKPGGGQAVRLVRGAPEVSMDSLTDAHIRKMLVNGGEWWLNNMRPDGFVEYKYWPTQNRRSTEYNEVRHILGTRDLADVYRYRNDPRYLDGSKRAMDWLFKYAIDGDAAPDPQSIVPHPPAGTLLFRYPSMAEYLSKRTRKLPNQKLGTVAVGLLGWVAWAQASGDRSQDENIRKLAKYVLSQQTPEGKFEAYYVPKQHPYFGNKNDIVPGEAALALGMVSEYFNEPEWIESFPKFLDFYTPWFRERAVRKNKFGRWPHATYSNDDRLDLVQFGPWSVMASKQYYKLTGDERAAAFGLEVADWMIDNYQWTEARSPWPDYVGGYYKMLTELPAMQTFCYSEGTAAAYQIASRFRPEEKDKYDLSTREAIRFLDVMQFDELDSYFVARPKKVFGGVKYTMNESKVRTDYVGHGLSTLSQYLDAREYDPVATLQVPDPAILDPIAAVPGLPSYAPESSGEGGREAAARDLPGEDPIDAGEADEEPDDEE